MARGKKATTVKMLIGPAGKPTDGEGPLTTAQNIHKDLPALPANGLGYVPEEANLYPYLTGQEYLDNGSRTLRAIARRWARSARINSLLELFFALAASLRRAWFSYSKGMRQRILLIAALMDNPDLLILDEGRSLASIVTIRPLIIKNVISSAEPPAGKIDFFLLAHFGKSSKNSAPT